MALQSSLAIACGEIEDLQGRIVGCSNEFYVSGREREVADGHVMSPEFIDIVEVCLPVFDSAFVVCRQEPVLPI